MRLSHFTFFLALLSFGAHAADMTDNKFPNTTDVHVAYCLEIEKHKLEMLNSSLTTANALPEKERVESTGSLQNQIEEEQSKIQRLKRYFLPRLVDSPNGDGVFEIQAAVNQAQQDEVQFQKDTGNLSSPLNQCLLNCSQHSVGNSQLCIEKDCEKIMPSSIKHIRRCINIESELPY